MPQLTVDAGERGRVGIEKRRSGESLVAAVCISVGVTRVVPYNKAADARRIECVQSTEYI